MMAEGSIYESDLDPSQGLIQIGCMKFVDDVTMIAPTEGRATFGWTGKSGCTGSRHRSPTCWWHSSIHTSSDSCWSAPWAISTSWMAWFRSSVARP